jgi:hypothetical protein
VITSVCVPSFSTGKGGVHVSNCDLETEKEKIVMIRMKQTFFIAVVCQFSGAGGRSYENMYLKHIV